MPTQTRVTLKTFFEKGKIPTAANFADLIDSTLNQQDDGLLTSVTDPLSIKAVGPEESLINFYRVDADKNTTTWQIKQKPADSSTPGLSIGTPTATRLFIDAVTGNIGIGTTKPASPLHVVGMNPFPHLKVAASPTAPSGAFLSIDAAATPGGKDYYLSSTGGTAGEGQGKLVLKNQTDNKLIMCLTSDGNVGIGTTTPGFPLTIGNNTLGDKISLWGQSGNHYGFGIQNNLLQIHTDIQASDIAFGYGTSAAFTEKMRIKGNGNVGIGTTAPGERLEVAGSVYISGSSYLKFDHQHGDANDGKIGNSMFSPGLNLVGINNDNTFRKIQLWGQITQNQNDATNTWGGTNFFNGRVGIGNSSPSAPLHVSGGAALGSFYLGAKVWPDTTGDDNNPNFNAATVGWGGTTHSIVSDLRIRASALDVTNIQNSSDVRIKRIVGRTSGAKDLLTLMEIEVTDYTFIDTATNGRAPQKKVVAQQIEKVFPQAASRATGVVPDLFQRADIRDGWIALATNLTAGERVRLIGEAESGVFEVLEVQSDRFRTEFKPQGERVFVYGREVKDFGSVDYDAIAMLNVSATQELARRVEAQAAAIEVLLGQNSPPRSSQRQASESAPGELVLAS